MPSEINECINSWKEVLPDYEIICWDEGKFDIKSVPFVNEAYAEKKWAFAADYIRVYALFNEGGIYLDSDVLVKKSFDAFLNNKLFTAVEYHPDEVKNKNTKQYLNDDGSSINPHTPIPGIGIQAAVMAGVRGHPFFKDCMEYYHNKNFITNNGTFHNKVIAPGIFAMTAENYGFKYIDKLQKLNNDMLVLPSTIFASAPHLANSDSYAIHMCAGSWRENVSSNLITSTINKLKKNSIIRRVFRKKPLN